MEFNRSSGILLHISSLPSPFGIGDLGPDAYKFVDFLADAGQSWWQILPLNPTRIAGGNSPYSSPSAFAGNPLFISPHKLYEEDLITKGDLRTNMQFDSTQVKYPEVIKLKKSLFEKAFKNFNSAKYQAEAFSEFCEENEGWLDDFALYSELSSHYAITWHNWPSDLRKRKSIALRKAQEDFALGIKKEKFLQYLFFTQWTSLKKYANSKNVKFIGDLPFYVSGDSVDCWANSSFFKLDKNGQPTKVSGVPPDMFSKTGQLWGTPVYDWKALGNHDFEWWKIRLRQNLKMVDVVRLDHFRAFSACWEVPASEATAENGKWQPVPGEALFKVLKNEFQTLPFIAEDLGEIDQQVYDLRDQFCLPGMNVLQYAFEGEWGERQFLPHNHIPHSVTYTGTHDNDTVRGWYAKAEKQVKDNLKRYVGRPINEANASENLQRLAQMSVSKLVVIPLQDVLNLGSEAVMNRPGTNRENWEWRVSPSMCSDNVVDELRTIAVCYDRWKGTLQ